MKLTDEQIVAIRDGCEARDVSDAKDDANIVSELLQWAASIDADGDDLRPLLRRAAEALTDRMEQIKSAVDGAAKFADRAAALAAEALESRALLDVDRLEEIITDSIDIDWTPRDAAKAIVRAMGGDGA